MSYSQIKACRACDSDQLDDFLSFGAMPLVDRLPSIDTEDELRIPLTVTLCATCSLVQLREIVEPKVLFDADYPYFSSVSESWVAHCKNNAEELVERLNLGGDSLVMEIASNDGYFLRHFHTSNIPVLGLEPTEGTATAAEALGIPTRRLFFGQDTAAELANEGLAPNLILANNVLAHVPDIFGFLSGIKLLLASEGLAVIEAPSLLELIKHCEFDTIYHEHMSYLSVTAVSALLTRVGLALIDVRQLPTHGGSLRYYLAHSGVPSAAVIRMLEEEKQSGLLELKTYQRFATKVSELSTDIRDCLLELKHQGHRLAAYGAAAKGVILLNLLDLPLGTLEYVVDRNPHKQGMRMPGVPLPIVSVETLAIDAPDYLVVLPWNLKEEILAQLTDYADNGGRFVFPIPKCEIVP
ncbi:MAG: class I SAM-dependent methyltransferase [Oceanococcus sp.]